jgi:hypothetical protein
MNGSIGYDMKTGSMERLNFSDFLRPSLSLSSCEVSEADGDLRADDLGDKPLFQGLCLLFIRIIDVGCSNFCCFPFISGEGAVRLE